MCSFSVYKVSKAKALNKGVLKTSVLHKKLCVQSPRLCATAKEKEKTKEFSARMYVGTRMNF